MEKGHTAAWAVFTLLALALYAGRIVLTRLRQDAGLAALFGSQTLLNLAYLLWVLVLARVLIRQADRPRRLPAFLLLLPLAADAWYLLPPQAWEGAAVPAAEAIPVLNLCAKALLSTVGFFAGLAAKKKPAGA